MTKTKLTAHATLLLTACLSVGCIAAEGEYDFGDGGPAQADDADDAEADDTDTGEAEDEGTDETPDEDEGEEEDTGSEDVELLSCDDLDAAYACPEGGELSVTGDYGFCWFPQFTVPPVDEIVPVCDELADGMLGFGWESDAMQDSYDCPDGAEQSSDDTHTFCLWTDIELPAGYPPATACHKLAAGQIGFFFACEPS